MLPYLYIQYLLYAIINLVHKGEDDDDEPPKYPWERPDGGFFKHVWWLLFFPMEILFFLTIPDVRR